MSANLAISIDDVTPTVDAILAAQYVPPASAHRRTQDLAANAVSAFRRLSAPAATVEDITRDEFQQVYEGDGHNVVPSALDPILTASDRLTLFAGTVGQAVSSEITHLFERNEFAAGTMLDAAASLGADLIAEAVENFCASEWLTAGLFEPSSDVMRFSPGYCGWHISGQKRLFGKLRPELIGIVLSDSCLMSPLKSVSGVVIAAPWRAFDIDDTFPFCAECQNHSCRDRFAALRKKHTL